MIFIITNKEDVHPTPVIEYLNERKIPVFRFNTEALLSDYEFRWWCDEAGSDFYMKDIQGGHEVYGHDITSVWELRPVSPEDLKIEADEIINKHNLKEANGFLTFLLYYFIDVFSLGSQAYDEISASKMLQLKIAVELGMKIPATCFSNRREDILDFARGMENIILKPIKEDSIFYDDEREYVFYAKKVETARLRELPEEAFTQTVSFVEKYIEKKFELRITVVGHEIFACKIDSQILPEDKGRIDWRQGIDIGLKQEKFDLPERIGEFCLKYLERMHLNFGCFDFIVTPGDEYVFLECNPNGQWLWVEDGTGLPITKAVAECLIRGKA